MKGFALNTARAREVQDDIMRRQEEEEKAAHEAAELKKHQRGKCIHTHK